MNIWIEAPFDSLPIEGYRKQRYWLMAEAFAKAGHRVVYWTSDFSHAKKKYRGLGGLGGLGGLEGFELKFIKTKPYKKNVSWARISSHRAYAKEWERAALEYVSHHCQPQPSTSASPSSPDLIISSIPPISAAATGLKLARHFGAKFVLDVMDAWPETFERLAPKGLRWLAKLLLTPLRRKVRRLYREADLVTGVCERYRELTGRRDYHLAYHGIDLSYPVRPRAAGIDKTEPALLASATARGRAGYGEERANGCRLVYIGNMGKTYDLKTVVAGMDILKQKGVEVTLDVAGFGGERDQGSGIGDQDRGVKFHGMLGEEALTKLLAESDIGIIPMKPDSWVGIPYKLCDYAKADLKIVSSLGGESGRLLEKYGCGVGYAPGDAESFAKSVLKAQNCRGGRILVDEVLSADKIYSKYVEKCEQI